MENLVGVIATNSLILELVRIGDGESSVNKTYFVRKHVRFRVNIHAHFRVAGTFAWQFASLLNLSKGGLCLVTGMTLNPGQFVELEFNTVDRTGGASTRKLLAEVRWKSGTRFGLKFANEKRKTKKSPS